jgi:Zn-dependent peptidase ImmA (M78 family)/DNA-binding XRE family transcriptional regulator
MKNVNQIKFIREQIGLSQEELGVRIGVTRQTIAAWESTERAPSVAQLSQIAQALGVPLPILLTDPTETESVLLFRADDPAELTPALRAILTKRASDYADVERFVKETGTLPESRPIDEYDGYLAEQTALSIRGWLGLGDTSPIGDALSLLENKGLKVICHALPSKLAGFSAFTEKWGGVIVVNETDPQERQYLTALHELGHLIFHRADYITPKATTGRSVPREKLANHFAGALLLPEEVVKQELHAFRKRWIPEPLLLDIKERYWVSMRTILIRAMQVGIIPKEQFGKQFGVLNRKYGPDKEAGEVPKLDGLNRLERLVYRGLLNEELTVSRAAEILTIPLAEVRKRLNDWMEQELLAS